nr:hypothetical protein CFP56_53568 [Quercus suber]
MEGTDLATMKICAESHLIGARSEMITYSGIGSFVWRHVKAHLKSPGSSVNNPTTRPSMSARLFAARALPAPHNRTSRTQPFPCYMGQLLTLDASGSQLPQPLDLWLGEKGQSFALVPILSVKRSQLFIMMIGLSPWFSITKVAFSPKRHHRIRDWSFPKTSHLKVAVKLARRLFTASA